MKSAFPPLLVSLRTISEAMILWASEIRIPVQRINSVATRVSWFCCRQIRRIWSSNHLLVLFQFQAVALFSFCRLLILEPHLLGAVLGHPLVFHPLPQKCSEQFQLRFARLPRHQFPRVSPHLPPRFG